MRRHYALAALLGTYLVFPAFATNVSVDCTGAPAPFTTITAALNTLDLVGPHTITVAGTCNEVVNLRARNNVTIDGGAPAPGAIHASGPGPLNIERSRGILLRRLTFSGGNRAVSVRLQSEVTIEGCSLESANTGLAVADASSVTVGGSLSVQAVNVHNNNLGISVDGSSLTAVGFLTVENSVSNGVNVEGGRLILQGQSNPSFGGPNVIHNNGGNGLFASGGADVDVNAANTIDSNTLNGAVAFESSTIDLSAAGTFVTSISNNARGGIAYIFNASGRILGATIQNNGSSGDPLRSGVSSAQNSAVIVDSAQVTGNSGPGVLVEAGGTLRLRATTVSASTDEPVRLHTGAKLELQTGNTLSGPGKNVVTCDGSSLLFGDDAGSVATDCKKP